MTERERSAAAERQAKYDARRRAQGMKRVSVYVPEDQVGTLKEYAAELRDERE